MRTKSVINMLKNRRYTPSVEIRNILMRKNIIKKFPLLSEEQTRKFN